MVNQLIQKPNRPPIKKTEEQISFGSISLLEKRLSDGFASLQYQRGIKSLSGMKGEYDSLRKIYEGSEPINAIINVERTRKLTDSLYQQGLQLLASALETVRQLGATDVGQLADEVAGLRKELTACSAVLAPIIAERIERNEHSLKAVKGYQDRADELFNQAGLCADSIREIRLELPELMAHKPQDEFDKTMLELNTRIEFAQRVKQEYAKQGI